MSYVLIEALGIQKQENMRLRARVAELEEELSRQKARALAHAAEAARDYEESRRSSDHLLAGQLHRVKKLQRRVVNIGGAAAVMSIGLDEIVSVNAGGRYLVGDERFNDGARAAFDMCAGMAVDTIKRAREAAPCARALAAFVNRMNEEMGNEDR